MERFASMMDLNKVELIGQLTLDPVVQVDSSGRLRATLRLAVESTVEKASGGTESDTEYHTVFLFGKLANIAKKYLKEGDRILVSGVGRYQSLADLSRRGHLRKGLEVVAENLIMLGNKNKFATDARSEDKDAEDTKTDENGEG